MVGKIQGDTDEYLCSLSNKLNKGEMMDKKAEKVLLELYEKLKEDLEENTHDAAVDEALNGGMCDRAYNVTEFLLKEILKFLEERVDFKTVIVMKTKEK